VSILKVSIRQIKAARALLGWSQDDLASGSGVSIPTIKRLEAAEGEIGGRQESREAIVGALQEGGIEFIAENGGSIGVRLAKRQRRSRGLLILA
jgi:transcriptional regulator with XRE-family HTH domain